MKWFAVLLMGVFLALMIFATSDLPDRGDPQAPANVRVSPYYIEHAVEETATPNIVTAVLADYRGYDTLGETIVIFTAGLVLIVLRRVTG